jgi:hypothetical protein
MRPQKRKFRGDVVDAMNRAQVRRELRDVVGHVRRSEIRRAVDVLDDEEWVDSEIIDVYRRRCRESGGTQMLEQPELVRRRARIALHGPTRRLSHDQPPRLPVGQRDL